MTLSRKALNNWEYSLGFILDSTYNGIIAVDKNGYIVVFNDSAKSLLNLREDVVGKYVLEVMPDLRLPMVLRNGNAELGQKMVINDRICLFNLTPIMKDDEVVGAVAVFEDITLMQRLVEEMSSVKELRNILQTLVETSNEGILIVDRSGAVSVCNQAFTGIIKRKSDKIMGKNISEIVPELGLTNVLDSGEQEFAELKHVKGSDVVVTSFPVANGSEVTGAVSRIMYKNSAEADPLVHKINILRGKLAHYREQLEKISGAKYSIDNIVGKSQILQQLKETLRKVAPGNSTILLRGETGTGKELFAHALHLESPRKLGPFVIVNCSALPENMLEAELFGCPEGVTPWVKKSGQFGKLELGDQGTVFLDEIGDLSLQMQAKLLKVMQDKAVHRVGEDTLIPVDVRIVAATNRNLEDLVRQKLFREDLYYRLNVLSFYIPPVRERQEDLEPLINIIIEKYNNEFGKKVIGVSSEVYNILMKHMWPGNVRELESVLERAFNVIEDQIIQPHHLPAYLKKTVPTPEKANEEVSLKSLLEDTERNALIQALQKTGGNKVKAARLLHISRAGLYQKLEKYDLLDE